jgi:hypothetical protein
METLRAFFHMGSVECVTCQVPRSQGRGGGVNTVVALEEVVVKLVVGARKVICAGTVEGAGSEDDMLYARRIGGGGCCVQ